MNGTTVVEKDHQRLHFSPFNVLVLPHYLGLPLVLLPEPQPRIDRYQQHRRAFQQTPQNKPSDAQVVSRVSSPTSLSPELLLQLSHQASLDLVVRPQQTVRNEDDDGLLAAPNVHLRGVDG